MHNRDIKKPQFAARLYSVLHKFSRKSSSHAAAALDLSLPRDPAELDLPLLNTELVDELEKAEFEEEFEEEFDLVPTMMVGQLNGATVSRESIGSYSSSDAGFQNDFSEASLNVPDGHFIQLILDPSIQVDFNKTVSFGNGIQILFCTDELLLCYLLGDKKSTQMWDAFLFSLNGLMTPEKLIQLLFQLFTQEYSLLSSLYSREPRSDGIVVVLSEPLKRRALTEAQTSDGMIDLPRRSLSSSDRNPSLSMDEYALTSPDCTLKRVVEELGLSPSRSTFVDNLKLFLQHALLSEIFTEQLLEQVNLLIEQCELENESYTPITSTTVDVFIVNEERYSPSADELDEIDEPSPIERSRSVSTSSHSKFFRRSKGRDHSMDIDQVDLFHNSPELIADCLTWSLYENVYSHIQIGDFLTDHSLLLREMISQHEDYAWWVLTCIFKKNIDVSVRTQRIVFFINVAVGCRRVRNYHTLFGIVAGLSQPLLKWMWDFVKVAEKQKFAVLERVVSAKRDYLVYKADLSKCRRKSHIPFLGATTKILTPLISSVPPRSAETNLINFSRCVSIQSTIDSFLEGQRVPYRRFMGTSSRSISMDIKSMDSPRLSLNSDDCNLPAGGGALTTDDQIISLLSKELNRENIKSKEKLDKTSQQLKKRLAEDLVRQLEKSGFM